MCEQHHEINVVTVKCDGCNGSGEVSLNDFSDPYKVTQYEDTCFHCNGDGEVDVLERVVEKCTRCHGITVIDKQFFSSWISPKDRESIKTNGYMERLCWTCQESLSQDYYVEEDRYEENFNGL